METVEGARVEKERREAAAALDGSSNLVSAQQSVLACLMERAVEEKSVSEGMLMEELKAAEMSRRIFELKKYHGIDFRRRFYVPDDSAHAQVSTQGPQTCELATLLLAPIACYTLSALTSPNV